MTRAEVMMSEIIVEHNLPLALAAADTLTKAFKLMFTDSRIAAGKLQYKSNNKTAYILIVDFLSNCRSTFLCILWIFYFMCSQCSNKKHKYRYISKGGWAGAIALANINLLKGLYGIFVDD